MSNYLAIATVTATLRDLVKTVAEEIIPGTEVTMGPPKGAEDSTPGINVYLYQVMPNTALRNVDLPTRRNNGTLTQRPVTALDLYYLLSFYGKDNELEPQRLLGSVAEIVHRQPVLSLEMIRSTIASTSYLAGSNLDQQVERVKLLPLPLNLEEFSKLWSAFFHTPYTLSVVYQASVVLIEGKESPPAALPVRTRELYVRPFRHPVIEEITSQSPEGEPPWADQPILAGHMLLIAGKQLRGDFTRVLIGGVAADPTSISDTRISLPLSSPLVPSGSLRAGVQGIQVIHKIMMGKPPAPHAGVESNVAAFVLRPRIDNPTPWDSAALDATFIPMVGKKQRVFLLLNEMYPPPKRPPHAYRFEAPKDNGITEEHITETEKIKFAISGVQPGEYLVRVQVDGAESPVEVDADGQYIRPKVTIQ
jgi:hypothetical protein